MKKIPEIYIEEYTWKQVEFVKNRTRLAAILFVLTFFAGSIAGTFVLHSKITPEVWVIWGGSLVTCAIALTLNTKTHSIGGARASAAAIMTLIVGEMLWYQMATATAPFDVSLLFVLMFFGFSLIFLWSSGGLVGVLLLHMAAYIIFLTKTPVYVYKDTVVETEVADYVSGIITMCTAFWVCYIVSKRAREREIENFVLLKENESKNKEMRKELEMATVVHNRLVPKSINADLADIAVTYLPMYYIGGDYTKFHFIDKDRLIFIICDVTGHGVPAALLVNAFHSEFERIAAEGKEPGVLLKEAESVIAEDFDGISMYLTAFCGLLDYKEKKFMYSNYGHPPQYMYHVADSSLKSAPSQTTFLGLNAKDDKIYQSEMPFDDGDRIFLYTDGVTEAKDETGEEFGYERLKAFIRANHDMPVELFNKKLTAELNSFTTTVGKFEDDVLMLSIQVK